MTPEQDRPADEPSARLLRALETMPVAFFSLDADFRISYVNRELERLLDRRRDELIGKELYDAFPAALGSGLSEQYTRLLEQGGSIGFEEFYAPLESWFEVHAWLDDECINVTFSNIDERRMISAQRVRALEEAEQANARLRFLTELSSSLAGVRTRAEVFDRLARAVVPRMCDWCTITVPESEQLVRVAARHRQPDLDALARRLVGTYPHAFTGPSPGVVAYKRAEPLRLLRLASDISRDLDDSAASAAYGRTLQLLGDGPGLIMPVISRGVVVALLTMVRIDAPDFNDAELAVMREAAARVAAALEEARHVETQREIANALQAVGLPTALPLHPRLRLAAGYRAASEGSQVGGDWYDAFELEGGHIALVVGDAAGHGLQASAVMAQMRNALRAYLFDSFSPSRALGALSRLIGAHYPEDFATVICLDFDPESGEASWASAGHPSPILVRADGTSAQLRSAATPPVGWPTGDEAPERDSRLVLASGDRLVLYTDGLVERRGTDIEIGIAHLMIFAEQTRTAGADDACEVILDQMLGSGHQDDVCLLVADFTETSPPSSA